MCAWRCQTDPMTERLPATPEGIARAAELLRSGSVVAFPTDTVYGLGVSVENWARLPDLYALKLRPVEKRIPILVAHLSQATGAGWEADKRALKLTERFWPGPLTIILPFCAGAPPPEEGESQAFRAPDHVVSQALIRSVGPIYATSANRSDEPDTLGADEVLIAFATQQDELPAVLDGGPVPGGVPSTIVDLSVAPARILRHGPVTRTELAALIDVN